VGGRGHAKLENVMPITVNSQATSIFNEETSIEVTAQSNLGNLIIFLKKSFEIF
jgi:hypothetical protein